MVENIYACQFSLVFYTRYWPRKFRKKTQIETHRNRKLIRIKTQIGDSQKRKLIIEKPQIIFEKPQIGAVSTVVLNLYCANNLQQAII
jgi:hypothetical protein